MARFREVEFRPLTGPKLGPWTEEPETDAWVKSARRVSELYGEALDTVGVVGPVGSIRFMTCPADDDSDAVRVDVLLDRPEGWESGAVWVPPGVAGLSPAERGRLVLDVLHGAVTELAPHRGWPVEALAEVRDYVLGRGLRFEWASSWRANQERSRQARAFFRLEDDGYGRVVIEVRDRRTEELLARSEDALAFCTLAGFKRAARTLTWVGTGVELVPYIDGLGRRDGILRLDPSRGVRPLRRLDAEAEATVAEALLLTITGARAIPDGPSIRIVGGGPTHEVPDDYLSELDRCLDAIQRDYLDWWSGADRQQLEIWYEFGHGAERPVTRRAKQKLIARIRRNPETIRRAHDRGQLARDDAHELMEIVGDKMGLGPQPGLRPE